MTAVLPVLPAQASTGGFSIGICGSNSTLRIPFKKDQPRQPDCPGACHAACTRDHDPGDDGDDANGDPGNP